MGDDYACWDCLDSGTIKIATEYGKHWVDCESCDVAKDQRKREQETHQAVVAERDRLREENAAMQMALQEISLREHYAAADRTVNALGKYAREVLAGVATNQTRKGSDG